MLSEYYTLYSNFFGRQHFLSSQSAVVQTQPEALKSFHNSISSARLLKANWAVNLLSGPNRRWGSGRTRYSKHMQPCGCNIKERLRNASCMHSCQAPTLFHIRDDVVIINWPISYTFLSLSFYSDRTEPKVCKVAVVMLFLLVPPSDAGRFILQGPPPPSFFFTWPSAGRRGCQCCRWSRRWRSRGRRASFWAPIPSGGRSAGPRLEPRPTTGKQTKGRRSAFWNL